MADYAVDFHTVAAESAWNTDVLFDIFLHGVWEEVKDKLAARELPTDLNSLIALTIRILCVTTGANVTTGGRRGGFHLTSETSWNSPTAPLPRESEATRVPPRVSEDCRFTSSRACPTRQS